MTSSTRSASRVGSSSTHHRCPPVRGLLRVFGLILLAVVVAAMLSRSPDIFSSALDRGKGTEGLSSVQASKHWHPNHSIAGLTGTSSSGTISGIAWTGDAANSTSSQQRRPSTYPSVISRAFPRWSDAHNGIKSPPCIVDRPNDPVYDPFAGRDQGQPSDDGLLFLKVDKAGSSTVAGVGARIAVALARRSRPRNRNVNACKCRLSHIWSKRMNNVLRSRDRDRSFLFAVIREPSRRAVSEFYFFSVGRGGMDPSERNLLRHLRSTENFQLAKCLTARREATAGGGGSTYAMSVQDKNDTELNDIVKGVLNDIDFIGTLERLDESMTLLQMILGLETRDVLFVPSKETTTSGYSRRGSKTTVKKNITPRVRQYLDGDEWHRRNRGDILLYEAVDASIDRTIDTVIGRDEFQVALQAFRRDEARVKQECDGPNVTDAERGSCYWSDSGCNYKCIDRLFPLPE